MVTGERQKGGEKAKQNVGQLLLDVSNCLSVRPSVNISIDSSIISVA